MAAAAEIIRTERWFTYKDHTYSILDPMAGIGRVHWLADNYWVGRTYGIEIEPEWAEMDSRTLCGNALYLPFRDHTFDCIFVSPVYGNRMSDHHNAKDASKRHGYKFSLGHDLHPDNSGQMYFWQQQYRDFHIKAWIESVRVLRPGGLFIINTKDFYRTVKKVKVHMYVTAWHMTVLSSLGLTGVRAGHVAVPSMKHGKNRERVAEGETLVCFRKPLDKHIVAE